MINKTLLIIVTLIITVSPSQLHSHIRHYELLYNGYVTHNMTVQIQKSPHNPQSTRITGHIFGNLVNETYHCDVSSSFQFLHLAQKTNNQIYNQIFEWEINQIETDLKGYFLVERLLIKDTGKKTFDIPGIKGNHTLQSLLFALEYSPLHSGDTLKYQLITPPHSIVPIKITVESNEIIMIQNQAVDCYKLVITLNSSWGFLVPKSIIWVQKAVPHYLVRYEKPGESAQIKQVPPPYKHIENSKSMKL